MTEREQVNPIVIETWIGRVKAVRIPLEYHCPVCNGYGSVLREPPKDFYVGCDECGGSGVVLSQEGELMLQFIERWGVKVGPRRT